MLKARKRLTKKEIKEDPLVTFYVNVRKQLVNHQKYLNYAAIGIAAIVLVSFFMNKSKKDAEVRANADLSPLEQQMLYQPSAQVIEEVENISENYSGTEAAGRATYLIANAFYNKGNYTEAKRYYEHYLDNYSVNEMLNIAATAGMAACFESEENYSEAARFYEKAAPIDPDYFNVPYHLQSAARCYLTLRDTAKSVQLYQKIVNQFAESTVANDAEIMIHML